MLPLALESDRALPVLEAALERPRIDRVVAPGITTVEWVVWIVLRLAERWVTRPLLGPLSPEQRTLLDTLLHGDPDLHGRTRLTWLRAAPEIASAQSLRRVLERLAFVRAFHQENIAFGFWPGIANSSGVTLGEPAFYSYIYPAPDGYSDASVRPHAAYFDQTLGEFILRYEDLRRAVAPEDDLLSFFQSAYEAAATLARWDRDVLEARTARTSSQRYAPMRVNGMRHGDERPGQTGPGAHSAPRRPLDPLVADVATSAHTATSGRTLGITWRHRYPSRRPHRRSGAVRSMRRALGRDWRRAGPLIRRAPLRDLSRLLLYHSVRHRLAPPRYAPGSHPHLCTHRQCRARSRSGENPV